MEIPLFKMAYKDEPNKILDVYTDGVFEYVRYGNKEAQLRLVEELYDNLNEVLKMIDFYDIDGKPLKPKRLKQVLRSALLTKKRMIERILLDMLGFKDKTITEVKCWKHREIYRKDKYPGLDRDVEGVTEYCQIKLNDGTTIRIRDPSEILLPIKVYIVKYYPKSKKWHVLKDLTDNYDMKDVLEMKVLMEVLEELNRRLSTK